MTKNLDSQFLSTHTLTYILTHRTPSPSPPSFPDPGCVPAEIIFMIEYSLPDAHRAGSNSEVDHEGDFVNALVEEWRLEDRHIRVGVIVFHDTAREVSRQQRHSECQRGFVCLVGWFLNVLVNN